MSHFCKKGLLVKKANDVHSVPPTRGVLGISSLLVRAHRVFKDLWFLYPFYISQLGTTCPLTAGVSNPNGGPGPNTGAEDLEWVLTWITSKESRF